MRRFQFRRRVPGGKMIRILWWDFIRFLSSGLLRILYRLRVTGIEHVPSTGPILFVSNHQSYFDPAINAMIATDRQFTAIAREKLFRFKPFGLLIRSIGALSVAGEGGDAAALKIALAELNAGRCILIYPEGTRSSDGTMQPFQRGVLLLQRRAKVDVVPVGLDGASDIWPRDRAKPLWRGRLAACAGPVIPASRLASMSADDAMELLESEVDRLRLQARAMIRERSGGRWPLRGPGDEPRKRANSEASPSAPVAIGDNVLTATDGEAR
ncbi:MAG: 1-acyl-sn-glycerol-3-phosphate acyltransferase [Phycisphaerae bacterium]|nr:1-acyl-sn-glycerol-3-phosphate acyltransferase [Phycisphaerae bacterium]